MKKSIIILLLLLVLGFIGTKAQQPIQMISGIGGYPILAPDGTAGAPTYSFSANPTTGIYNSSGVINFDVTGSVGTFINSAGITSNKFTTNANCTSSAAPAVCAAAASGSVVVAAAGTTVTVNTTAVTANSTILLTFDSSLSTKLSVTCNTTVPTVYSVSARTAATSFVITATSPTTNPACFSYLIFN